MSAYDSHANGMRVHTSRIRMTYEYAQKAYDSHMDDVRMTWDFT